jgi:hypothetical protein
MSRALPCSSSARSFIPFFWKKRERLVWAITSSGLSAANRSVAEIASSSRFTLS